MKTATGRRKRGGPVERRYNFYSPYRSVNRAIEFGDIDKRIPNIKLTAMNALEQKFTSKKEGYGKIRTFLESAYQEDFEDYYTQNKPKIESAIKAVTGIYQRNFYPEMKVDWKAHPDNIGHLISPGCFRCHDGEHKSKDGAIIRRDCDVCHSIIEQGLLGEFEKSTEGLDFRHPTDIDGEWRDTNCSECHTGGEVD
ncbi:hypothetical protein ACFL5V_09575 [Fibrobacterota bacterium]